MGEFARSFNNADTLLITDIYAASEEPIQGVSGETLTEAIQRYGHKDVRYVGGLESAAQTIREHIQPGDMVITLGAGTVYRVGDQIVELLRGRSEAKGV
jgi:UDP-N-acetylmuramate--alanine ligase